MEQLQYNFHQQNDLILKKKINFTIKDFKITKIINLGNQSNFYQAQSTHYKEKIILKSIQFPQSQQQFKQFFQRVKNQIIINLAIQQSQIANKNNYFPQFHGYFIENDKIYLIFEHCRFNSIQMCRKLKTYDQKFTFCLILLHDMIECMKFLDQFQIILNDIKPQNILLKKNRFKLADFQLAQYKINIKNTSKYQNNVIKQSRQVYVKKDNIQSLGYMVLFLLQGKLQFDTQTSNLISGKDIQKFDQKMEINEFMINMNKRQNHKQNNFQVFPLYQILNKMFQYQLGIRKNASQVYNQYFSIIQFDQEKYQKVIKDIIFCEKSQIRQNQGQLLKFVFLKGLQHREEQLGIYYIVFMSCLKQMLKINRKLLRLNHLMLNPNVSKNKKIFLQIKLLKNIKISCIKLVQILYKIMIQESFEQFLNINPITSFGYIHLTVQKDNKFTHEDQKKLQNFIKILLDNYSQYLTQYEDTQNDSIAKIFEEQICKKSVKFNNVLVCISQNTSQNQIKQVNFNEKSFSKIKSQKKVQSLQKIINNKLPKSIKYLNDENSCKEINQKDVLDNFLKFYSKDNLKQKFPLLAQVTLILKKLIETQEDPIKKKIFVQQEFKIWDLSLDLFRI